MQVVHGKESCFALNVKTGAEDHRKAQDHKFDSPAHRSNRRPEGLLQIHQYPQVRYEKDDVQDLGYRTKPELRPMGRPSSRNYLKKLVLETERYTDGQQSENGQRNSPAPKRLAVIAARISQAEAQPGRG